MSDLPAIAAFFALLLGVVIACGITGVFFFRLSDWALARRDRLEAADREAAYQQRRLAIMGDDEDLDPEQV